MNLLFVLPGGVHQSGEVDVIPVLLNLFRAFSVQHRVVVVALEQHQQLTEYSLDGIEVISLPKVKLRHLFGAAKLAIKRLAHYDFQPDVVHAFWLGKPTLLASLLAKKYRKPLFSTIAGGELIYFADINYGGNGSLLKRGLNRLSLRLCDGASCGSVYLQQKLNQQHIDAQFIPLGLDQDFWSLRPMKKLSANQTATGSQDSFAAQKWQLIQVASINGVKDPWLMLDVLVALKQADFSFQFNWVGVDTLAGAVQCKAESLGLSDVIVFHGFKRQKQLKAMLQQQDFIVQTSRYESQGVAMMEACSQGVCPVGTAVGWLYDVSLGVAANTTKLALTIAEHIIALAKDVDAREQQIDKAQQWLVENDLEATKNRFSVCYDNIIALID